MEIPKKLIVVFSTIAMITMAFTGFTLKDKETVSATMSGIYTDLDEDGRPDQFEIEQGLDETENDLEWTFLVYCCGDDVPANNRIGTLLPEMWEFIEKLSWVGCTDNITIVVQFDGSDVLDPWAFHQDMFWNDIPNNRNKPLINGTTTRRFLVGKDSKGWNSTINLLINCTDNTVTDLFDVTDWDPMNTGKAHNNMNWEANMADPNTLHEFISWGMDTFPSDNYCLYIDSHGDGVNGFGYDYRPDTNPTTITKDVLNLSEIQTLSNLLNTETPPKRLDMVMFQSCFMGNLEMCKEFSDIADYYVASENLMHSTGNQDDKVLEQLDLNPTWSPNRLAKEFIDIQYTYSRDSNSTPPWNISDWNGQERLTFSNMNNSYISTTDLYSEMTAMNTAILNGVSTNNSYNATLLQAVSYTDAYTDGLGYVQIDYYHFLECWNNASGPNDGIFSTLQNASKNMSAILHNGNSGGRGIEHEKHDAIFNRTKGIAIYCPDATSDWLQIKPHYQYSFIDQQTGWGHIVESILAARGT